MIELLTLVGLLALIAFGGVYAFKQGESKAKAESNNKQMGKVLDAVKEAKNIADHSSDDDYAKRVQDRFTRK